MANKYKATGCARIGLFLLILLPIAYFGAQYLKNNGVLDSVKEKVHEKKEAETPYDEFDRNGDNQETQNSNDKDIIKQQEERIRQLEEQMKQNENQSAESNRDPWTNQQEQPQSTNTGGTPALEDLFKEYDRKTGNRHSTDQVGQRKTNDYGTTATESLGTWQFTYGQMSGNIEFYTRGDILYSRVSDGRQSSDYEMQKQNGRYYVKSSPTGEYYELKPNGDLDAFDQNGFQTTCSRVR